MNSKELVTSQESSPSLRIEGSGLKPSIIGFLYPWDPEITRRNNMDPTKSRSVNIILAVEDSPSITKGSDEFW